ncbi:hypothetical protein FEM03_07280 [Phragmitibacter flavus]|uniref:Uncharacterized protein n=1 Tax=Phragmitibacter flavus TaxID=2576071 RepID=A0A5R8KH67_9BACT|nr:hypothetical protein [Phragmitibacter flavus]TLD71325.1 hypothetical protein FEM03_07280 [Phragmitibacter flavus]
MNEFYTRLYEKAELMFATLAPIAFVLIVLSLWSNVSNGNRSATMYLRAFVHAAIIVLVLSQFTIWLTYGETIVHTLVHDTLQANPAEVYERYKAMTASSSDEAEGGFWHTIFNLSEKQLFKALITAVLWTVQWIAKFTVFIAYVIYKVVLAFAIAASPIFIGFLSVRTLSSVGVRFILSTVGILIWPLGWGFASLVTDTLIEILSQESFVEATGMEELKNLIAVAAAGLWIIFSTISAPMVIQRMISEGTNAGAAFLSGGWRAARSGVSGGASTGAALAGSGVGAPVAALGAAGAGALAFGSSSLSGYGSSSIPGVVGSAVDWSAKSKSSQSSKAKPNSAYTSSDPANDRQAASIIGRARKSNRRSS